MKSIPPLAAALVAVIGFPLGWLVSGMGGPPPRASVPEGAGHGGTEFGRLSSAALGSKKQPGGAADSEAAVAGKVANGEANGVEGAVARAQRAMIERLRTAKPEQMTEMLLETAWIGDQYERRSVRELLYAHWGRMDPEGALAYMREYEQGSQLTNYLRALIRVDKEAALQAAQSIGEKDAGAPSLRWMTREWARIDPRGFMAALDQWPNHSIGGWSVDSAFQEMCRESPDGARQAVEALKNPWTKANAAFGLSREWTRDHPEEALAFAESQFDPKVKGAALRGVLGRLAETDPDRAKALYEKHRDVMRDGLGLDPQIPLAEALARRSPAEAAEFVRQEVEENERAYYVKNTIVPRLANAGAGEWIKVLDATQVTSGVEIELTDPWKGFQEAAALPVSAGRALVMNELAGQIASMDARRALEAAAAAGPDAVAIVAPLAAESMIERVEPEGFGQVASRLAEDERGQFYTRMSNALGTTSPSKLEAFIGQIPDEEAKSESRVAATNHWTTYQPALALDFVARQPEAEHANLSGNLAYTWAGQDAWATSQWVGSLESGAVRDTAVFGMGLRLAQDEPDSALAWTATIGKPEMRENAMLKVLGQWQQDDPAAARAAAATVPLSEASRRRLEAMFQSEEGGGR